MRRFIPNLVLDLTVVLCVLAVSTGVNAATWSPHFDQIQDPVLRQKFQGYRNAGWAATFKTLSKGKSAAQLAAEAIITENNLTTAIAADRALLAKANTNSIAPLPKAAECVNPRNEAVFAACDEISKTDQLSALQGLVELLPTYASELPAAPATISYGNVNGPVVATTVIRVSNALTPRTAALHPKQNLLTPATKTLAVSNMDTVIISSILTQSARLKPGTRAAGFTVTPAVGVLLPTPGRTHSPFVHLHAVGPGTVTIRFYGPWETAGTCGGASPNWSGYVVNAVPTTGITGSWVVPTVNAHSSSGVSSTWIGIDGCAEGNQLIQTGTEQDMDGGAFGIGAGPAYSAWWEVLPQFGSTQSFSGSAPVFPGDLMTASIVPVGTPAVNTASSWVLTLTDKTRGWSQSTTQQFNGSLDEAEWIEEATTTCLLGCSAGPLADYQTVTFDAGDTLTLGAGAPVNPGFIPGQRIVMNSGSANFSTPSNPNCSANGFTAVPGLQIPAPPGPLFVSATYPQGTVGVPYSQTIQTTGTAAVTLNSGSVPGLTFADGNLSGTPTKIGTFSLSLTGSDVNGNPALTCSIPVSVTIWPVPVPPPPPPPSFSGVRITLLTGNDDLRNNSDLQVNFTGITGWPGNQCLVQGDSNNVVAGSACSGSAAGDWNPVVGSWNGWPAWTLQTQTKQIGPGALTFTGSGTMTLTFSTHGTGCGTPIGGCGTSNDNWDIEALKVELIGNPTPPNSIVLFNGGDFGAAHQSGTCFWRVRPPGGHDPNSISIAWNFPPTPGGNGCPND